MGTGSSPPCGCDGEDGGNIQAAGRCVQLWPVDEVEGGRRRALHPPDWKAMETWCTPQTWREESNTKVHHHAYCPCIFKGTVHLRIQNSTRLLFL